MVQKVISFFVIFLFCGVLVAQNQNENEEFLNAQFLILDEVQPLTRAERESMESIFHAEFAVLGFRDIAFNIAMSRTLENLEYYIHYYKEEIAKRAYLLYNEEESRYRQKMGISDYSLETIKPKLKEQSEAIALYEARTFGYPDILSHIKEDVYLTYEKEISDVYIRNDAVGLSYNLGLVLQNRERLNLDAIQVDSIVAAAFEIKVLIADGDITEIENNCWLYERQFIMEILDEEQAGDFAIIRYTDDAMQYAIEILNEARDMLELPAMDDDCILLADIFHYRLNKLQIQYIYYDDKEKMQEMLNFWYREAYPKILAQLMAERRRRQVEEADDRDSFRF